MTEINLAGDDETGGGFDYESDTAILDFTNGIIPINVVYSGGVGANDDLIILGGDFDSIVVTFDDADPSAGVITLDGAGASPAFTVTYTGLEPVLLNVGTATDITFELPDADNTGANAVTLSDGATPGEMVLS